jgi:NADP-dependent 3-hydroxy acid dehydrogenase YdfG
MPRPGDRFGASAGTGEATVRLLPAEGATAVAGRDTQAVDGGALRRI